MSQLSLPGQNTATTSSSTVTTVDPTKPRQDVGRKNGGNTTNFTASSADNDRDDKEWTSAQASAAAYQEQMAIYQQQMMAQQQMAWMYGYGGYDPYGYDQFGYMDPSAYAPPEPLTEKWGEVSQTSRQELEEAGAIREYGEDAILVIANGPEDMRQLNHDAEADMIANAAGGRQTVVLWNPAADALSSMLKEGKFKDVVLSGHGTEGSVYMTGADGTAVAVDGKTFTSYFQDTGVKNVFLNMCHGAGGQNSVAKELATAGMNVLGWQTTVKDNQATEAAAQVASLFADGSDLEDLNAAAASNTNLAVTAAQPKAAEAPAAAPAPEPAPAQAPAAVEAAAPVVGEGVQNATAAELPIDPYYYAGIDWASYNLGNYSF